MTHRYQIQPKVSPVDKDLARVAGMSPILVAEYRTGQREAAPWLRRLIAEHTRGPRS
jgi:hypothetical protein